MADSDSVDDTLKDLGVILSPPRSGSSRSDGNNMFPFVNCERITVTDVDEGHKTQDGKSCQLCNFELDVQLCKNVVVCKQHNIRLCNAKRDEKHMRLCFEADDGGNIVPKEHLLPDLHLSCYDRWHIHEPHLPDSVQLFKSVAKSSNEGSPLKYRRLNKSCERNMLKKSLYEQPARKKTKKSKPTNTATHVSKQPVKTMLDDDFFHDANETIEM
jgi:hypothetical protein